MRDPEIERRLENWSRWKLGGASGGLGFARVDMGSTGGSSAHREAVIPTWDTEAAVTDQAVQALESPMREAVEAYYLRGAMPFEVAYSLDIALRTLQSRINRAFYALQLWFQERESRQAQERARVEALIKTST